ncbi:MAG: cell division topological specificity factor MinE [Candidatus Aquirickettsiella sp.]
MSLLNYIFRKKPNTATLAKERLQIIVSHERRTENNSDFLPKLQQELIGVIAKYYVGIDPQQVKVDLERAGNCSILELNITLPNAEIATDSVD